MRILNTLLLAFFLACFVPMHAQTGVEDSIYIRTFYTKTEQYITMRDGVRLFTSIYTPKDKSKTYPILLNRTPYSVAPYGVDAYRTAHRPSMVMAREGYIFVYQDVRGRWMSEGEFEDIRPYNPNKKSKKDTDESSDTWDTIDWLIKNVAGNNGRVGVSGISYPGFYSTMSLLDAHPALKAVSPQAPVTDWFIGDDFHHNGALFLLDGFSFYSGFGQPRPKPTTVGPKRFDWPVQDNYKFFLDMGPLRNAKARYFGDSIRFWNDLMAHPNLDEFWKARNPRPHLKNIKPAVLTVGGLFDAEDCFGAWRVYEAIEKQNPATHSNRLVMGPWSHGQWARNSGESLGNIHFGAPTSYYFRESIEKVFFNYYLKDEGAMALPEASIFLTGANEWRAFETWPPKNTVNTRWYLQPGQGLSQTKPTAREGFAEYISDPGKPVPYAEHIHLGRTAEYMLDDQRFAARRPDVLVFETAPLQENFTATGPITAELYVTTTGTDADFVVKVIDVFPDNTPNVNPNEKTPMGGYQMLVRGEVMRGRYRNSFEKPEPFVPGQVTKVRFELPDIAHTFKKGHRLMVQVQSSWFPLVDRNPQTFVDIYQCGEESFQKATHRVFYSAQHASFVEMPGLREGVRE
ncbi:MAG: CocE/NonD family hydrolase [Saprospiraceae bacterium]|nr:CocE/NonD family hydrolase [Saprospiraceae bacterium]